MKKWNWTCWEEDEMLERACDDLADYLAQFIRGEGERYWAELKRRHESMQETHDIINEAVNRWRKKRYEKD